MAENPRESDRQVVRRVTRAAGSNFTCAMMFLSRAEKEALEAVYAFTRRTDDIVDDQTTDADRAARLDAWQNALAAALDGGDPSGGGEEAAILRRFAAAARDWNMRADAAFGVIEGCRMDLTRNRYESMEELRLYCYRVASCVGLLCIPIFGAPQATAYAEHLGIAFQLTNILRDVAVDYRAGRIYLPAEEMAACGVTEADLAAGRTTEPLRQLVTRMADYAQRCYREADAARPRRGGRRLLAPQLMRHVYHRILAAVRAPDHDLFGPPVRISRTRKAFLALRTWLAGR